MDENNCLPPGRQCFDYELLVVQPRVQQLPIAYRVIAKTQPTKPIEPFTYWLLVPLVQSKGQANAAEVLFSSGQVALAAMEEGRS